MKQVLQDLQNGETYVEEVPCPSISEGSVLIQTKTTLVSAGTERMLVDFGKGNLLQKARQQPDKVKQVLDKAKTDGVLTTIDAVKNKLAMPIPLGYCNVGIVLESKCPKFAAGDRVASNGKHAEIVAVPSNLCAKIPDSVSDENAVFTVIAAIALQGIRLIKPTLGETMVVTGLGIIGLIAVQLLRANGCKVIGIDFDANKLALAKEFGAIPCDISNSQDPIVLALQHTASQGVDGVLITASTESNEPIHQAATMCRKRGRIVLVGVVGMEMSRADFYEKELSFQVSCSYGPGRYDEHYEEQGNDYPIGFVRWTEQRNFEAVLAMLNDHSLDFSTLVSHRYKLQDVKNAYKEVSEGNPLGVLLDYDVDSRQIDKTRTVAINQPRLPSIQGSKASVGFIGAGNYTSTVLAPAFATAGAELKVISSATGLSGVLVSKKCGIKKATTDSKAVVDSDETNALVITTRHDSHAKWVKEGLIQGKHIFVEKPLALTRDELDSITKTYESLPSPPILMVGFNRRYSPQIETITKLLRSRPQPKSITMTINAGAIPEDHWTQNPKVGGGRIIGEACHFVDLLRHLVGHPIKSVSAIAMEASCKDSVSVHSKYADGSIANLNYFANGDKGVSKERLEIYVDGGIVQLDNFRVLRAYGLPLKKHRLLQQDKGQRNCVSTFLHAIETADTSKLIPMHELIEVMQACFDIAEQISYQQNTAIEEAMPREQ